MIKDFYIVLTSDINYEDILNISKNRFLRTPRLSLDKTKAIIQLNEGQQPTPILDPYTALSREEAAKIVTSDEWQEPNPLEL